MQAWILLQKGKTISSLVTQIINKTEHISAELYTNVATAGLIAAIGAV